MATSMPLNYKRLYSGPLDEDSVFNSLQEAQTYASSPTSYPGQIIGVKGPDNKWIPYIIQSDKSLSEMGGENNKNNECIWEELV